MADSHNRPGHVTIRAERATDTVVVIRAGGEVDVATGTPLRDALDLASADPTVRLLVCDLSNVTFLACDGLTMLLAARSTMDGRGAELRVVAVKPILLRLFALSGLTETLSVHTNPRTALAHLVLVTASR